MCFGPLGGCGRLRDGYGWVKRRYSVTAGWRGGGRLLWSVNVPLCHVFVGCSRPSVACGVWHFVPYFEAKKKRCHSPWSLRFRLTVFARNHARGHTLFECVLWVIKEQKYFFFIFKSNVYIFFYIYYLNHQSKCFR